MLSSEESAPFFPAWASPVLPPSLPLLLASKPVTVRSGSDDRCGAPLHESPSRDPPSFFAACPIGSPGPSNKLSHTSAAGKGGDGMRQKRLGGSPKVGAYVWKLGVVCAMPPARLTSGGLLGQGEALRYLSQVRLRRAQNIVQLCVGIGPGVPKVKDTELDSKRK